MLADWIDARQKDKSVEDHDLIVMGDFNTPSLDDKTFKALTRRGLQVPDSLLELKVGDVAVKGSNLGKDARYDHILHLPTARKRFTNFGGILDFHVSDASIEQLFPGQDMTRTQFTYQLSDHFPVWVQIKTDIDGERLSQIVQNAKKD
jgi:endonuclease/exonuclease/phosphatase family metal-dependent hydrolase